MKIENVNLLVVDDDEMNCIMLSRILTKKDYNVTTTESGKKALDLIEENNFDLILLDIVMPGINGIELLKIIRQKYSMIKLPIIMVTAKDEVDDIIECLELGANDYIGKPINLAVVSARVQTQVFLKKTEEERENLLKDLHRLNYDKDKFFSIISHDLRTPITPIIGAAECILDFGETLSRNEIKSYAEAITNSAENLSHLLESMLQWSGIQIGRIEYKPGDVFLFELVNENIDLLRPNAAKKDISLINGIGEKYKVYADKNMITTVI